MDSKLMKRIAFITALVALATSLLFGAQIMQQIVTNSPAPSAVNTFVQTNNQTGTATTTAFTNPLTNPSIIIVAYDRFSATCTATPTDTAGHTYVDAGAGSVLYNASAWCMRVYYALNTSTTASNIITGPSGSHISASEWTGGKTSSPLDVSSSTANGSSGTGGGQNLTSGTAVTTANGDLIFGEIVSSGCTSVIGTGFTQIGFISPGRTEYLTQVAAASIAATMSTATNNCVYGAIMATFKAGP